MWGIIVTSKLLKFNLDTVNDTPLIEIDPFSTMNFLYFFSNANLKLDNGDFTPHRIKKFIEKPEQSLANEFCKAVRVGLCVLEYSYPLCTPGLF